MTTEKEMMRSLHAIREQIYEETKNMTPEERAASSEREVTEQAKKFGLTLKRPSATVHEPAVR